MCACSVDHGTSPQCTGHDVVRITRGIIQIAAEHQAATTHLYHMRKLSQRLLHIGANLGGMLGIIAVHKRGERRGTRRDGQAAATEGRTMIAGLKDVGDFLLCHHGTHRHTVGNALGKAHDVGLHAIGLERKRLTRTKDSALDLVGNKHGTHLVRQVARRSHKLSVMGCTPLSP